MKFSKSILALLAMSCAASYVRADDGAIGGICRIGEVCGVPGQPGQPDPSPYDPVRPGVPGRPDPRIPDRKEVYLGQYVRDQDLNLLSLFNMNVWNDRGTQIESVEITTQPGDSFSLSLLADGYLVAGQNYPSYYTVLYPNRALVIGSTLQNNLSLAVRGKVFIERIAINLRFDNPYPPGQNPIVLTGSVYQNFYGPGNIDIARIANVMAYRGYRLVDVTVNGRTIDPRFRGSARLMANGIIEQQISFYNYDYGQIVRPFRQYVVGQNLNSLTLLVDGNVAVSTIQVQLSPY